MLSISIRPLQGVRRALSARRMAKREQVIADWLQVQSAGRIPPDCIVWRLVGTTWKPVDFIRGLGYMLSGSVRRETEPLTPGDLIDVGELLVFLADKIDEEGL